MSIGRNDPCPCGSGKKYKHCCAMRDAHAAPTLSLLGRSTISEVEAVALNATHRSVPWEADVAPVMLVIESEPAARPAALILATASLVIHTDVITRPPASADGVAALIANAIDAQIARGAAPPSHVRVRHALVARALAKLLAPRGITGIDAAHDLPALDEFLEGLRRHMTGIDGPVGGMSRPETWAAWDLPAQTVTDIFEAAAAFHVAAPWSRLTDVDVLDVTTSTGSTWQAAVMGNGGEHFGLALYESIADVEALYGASEMPTAFANLRASVISLSFDPRSDLPKPMRREMAKGSWVVDGPDAYPWLWTHNTIGGGLSEAAARDLVATLDAITGFVLSQRSAVGHWVPGLPIEWTDHASGTTIRSAGFMGELPSLWDMPLRFTPALPEGERADPRAFLDEEDHTAATNEAALIIARFVAAERAKGSPRARIARDEGFAWLFTDIVHGIFGIALCAVTEYDLRVFLYDLFIRKSMARKSDVLAVRASLGRFFGHLADQEGVRYPWARAILRDKQAFEIRYEEFPGGTTLDDATRHWMSELYADLEERAMMPSLALAGGGEWSGDMGFIEASLLSELQREFLIWRDEIIRSGINSPADVRAALAKQQETWETKPLARLKGRSPSAAIKAERRKTPRRS